MTTNFVSPTCSILPVRELHGRTPKAMLADTLVPLSLAAPGEIVAIRRQGWWIENSPNITATTYVVRTHDGFEDVRLCDLEDSIRDDARCCAVRLHNDYEIYQEVPDEFFEHAETAPTRFEVIDCCGAVLLCWLDEWRGLDQPPVLTQAARWPAAVLIEEKDLRKRRDISARITLCETFGKLRIALPVQAAEQR
ncbi:hypothetical protein ACR03S_19275 (plasmid) [Limimaricola variabilis]|uniref:hypothetical protein n=1 Tax=Limimaricola variabilis TaxID=1492771 RepID=UPI002AC8F674|nr:hypothetical protein [Limimaricola variabilis]WPY96991.1 hypothetical protein T8T21_20140 [Limimaricola variabilis]